MTSGDALQVLFRVMQVLSEHEMDLASVLPSGDIDVLCDGITRLGLGANAAPAPSPPAPSAQAQATLPPATSSSIGATMALTVPPPEYAPEFAAREHAPPLTVRFPFTCNCGRTAGVCAVEEGGELKDIIDNEFAMASNPDVDAGGWMDPDRAPNNEQRKRVYRDVACRLKYTFRAPLPHCAVAAVRTCWPSNTGIYMGYKATFAGMSSDDEDDDEDDDVDRSGMGGSDSMAAATPDPFGGASHNHSLSAQLAQSFGQFQTT